MRWAKTRASPSGCGQNRAFIVGRLDRILDTLFRVLLVIHNFGSQRALASLC